jgi:acyl-CoA synthetase
MAAAVGIPDPVLGERVVLFVTLRPDRDLDLESLRSHLEAEGVTKEWWPERLVVLDELPRASGGKVAKAQLRNYEEGP